MKYEKLLFLITVIMFVAAGMIFISCSGKPAAKFSGKVIKVLTINVWSGLDYRGTLKMGEYESPGVRESRYRALLAQMKELGPDIIGINEANFLPDYIDRLAEDLGYDCLWHVGVSGLKIWRFGLPSNLREGDAILARPELGLKPAGRKQLSGGGFVWNCLSFHTADAIQVLAGRVNAGGEDIYIAVTHLRASPENSKRNRQLLLELKGKYGYTDEQYMAALERLERDNSLRLEEAEGLAGFLATKVPAGAPVILMGDFNAEIDWPAMKLLSDSGYRDTFKGSAPGYTWDAEKNLNIRKYYGPGKIGRDPDLYSRLDSYNQMESGRIDFILVNDAMSPGSVKRAGVCMDRISEGVHPSDHFGVFAIFQLSDITGPE